MEIGMTPLEFAVKAYEIEADAPCCVSALQAALEVLAERSGVEAEAILKALCNEPRDTPESIGGEPLAGSGFETEQPTA
jgi:hypothetical protein